MVTQQALNGAVEKLAANYIDKKQQPKEWAHAQQLKTVGHFPLCREAITGLKIIASRLPVVMELSSETHIITAEEAAEMYPTDQVKNMVVIPKGPHKGKVLTKEPVLMARNHYRRLRKIYWTGGEPAVITYIREVKGLPVM